MFLLVFMKTDLQKHNIFHYCLMIFVYLIKGIIGEFIWLLAGVAGYFIFQAKVAPYDLIVGLPLIVISVGFIVNSIGSQLLAVFSSKYNKGVCVICNPKDDKD